MTTLEGTSVTGFIAMKVLSSARKRREASERVKRESNWVISTVRFVWHIAGFSCLTIAGFSVHFVAGMVIAGMACFALSTLTTRKAESNDINTDPMLRQRR